MKVIFQLIWWNFNPKKLLGDLETSETEADQVSESLAIPKGPKKVVCPEDDDFLSALDKMVSENIQERMREPVKSGNLDISVPVVMKNNKKNYEQLQVVFHLIKMFVNHG